MCLCVRLPSVVLLLGLWSVGCSYVFVVYLFAMVVSGFLFCFLGLVILLCGLVDCVRL